MAGVKIYTFFAITVSMLAFVTTLSLPAKYQDNAGSAELFARCVACHPEKADTVKSSEHYSMKCLECHRISEFQQDRRHTSTIPQCSDCHAGVRQGRIHAKFWRSEPVNAPQNSRKEETVYVTVKPANTTQI